jgi:Mg-chelatase subunit ChlD
MKTTSRVRILTLISGAGIILAAGIPRLFGDGCDLTGLDETAVSSGSGVDYTINYRNDADTDAISDTEADSLADACLTTYTRYVTDMGFRAPYLTTLPAYPVVCKQDDTSHAEPECIVMDSSQVTGNTEVGARIIFTHERFHGVQRAYKCDVADCDSGYIGSTFGKWVSEGTADAMMDKLFADADDQTGWPFYEGSASNYLADPTNSIFDREYEVCLFWNYMMEQLGTAAAEPGIGTDFMVDFWDQAASNGDSGSAASKLALEQTVAARGRTLTNVFTDFAICNYTHEKDTGSLSNGARYRYIDEATQPLMGALAIQESFGLAGLPRNNNGTVEAFAAKYFELDYKLAPRCQVVGYRCTSDETAGFAAVAVGAGGKVLAVRKGSGTEFAATFFNSPTEGIEKLCGIVVGLDEAPTYEYDMDEGLATVTIVRPTFTRPAYPGPAATPENIIVRVKILGVTGLEPEGPDQPSIAGLLADDFTVTIGSANAPVIYANYVGGEYWLLVDAPTQAADGLYPVKVQLCDDDGPQATQQNAVIYGEIRFNHVVTIDVSGSMESPTSAKLEAAKEAAKFYIDAVNSADRITAVSFSGDGTECNEDADNLRPAGGLYNATAANRTTLKNAVAALPSENLTSIGDGIFTAQTALETVADPVAIDTILLLTDGMENEDRRWNSNACMGGADTLRTFMLGKGTIINAIAFGDDAETELLQSIAADTQGDYSYIQVDPEGAASPRSPAAPSSFTKMQNRLSMQFLAGLEQAKSLQRLATEKYNLGANQIQTFMMTLAEDNVGKGLIYVGWNKGSSLTVTVRDPDGINVQTYCARFNGPSHAIFHANAGVLLKDGAYSLQLAESAGQAAEIFAGVSGVPDNGLAFECYLHQLRTGADKNESEHPTKERYEQGVPVDIQLFAYDKSGPVTGSDVKLLVILPDGTPACPKLFPMTDDGHQADHGDSDGFYGFHFTKTAMAASIATTRIRDEKPETQPVLQSGNYRCVITANGKAHDGTSFSRTFEKTFQVYQRIREGDLDQDELPDTWEDYYHTKLQSNDAGEDPDGDGLPNKEEFRLGTHPFDSDTDDGGEADGTEVADGLCPIDRTDDRLPPMTDVGIITTWDAHGNGANLVPKALRLQFPDHVSYRAIEIYRHTALAGLTTPAHLLKTIDVSGKVITDYLDEGLNDGTQYFYAFRALGQGISATPFSRPVDAVAKADPFAPDGTVTLDNHAASTSDLTVNVTFTANDAANDYRLSQAPLTPAVPWTVLPASMATTFTFAGLTPGQNARLFYQFRSTTGNLSPPAYVTIRYLPALDTDGDGAPNTLDNDDDGDGVTDAIELNTLHTDPLRRDTDGDGYSDNVEQNRGTDPLDRFSVPDSDSDGVADGIEANYGTNPNLASSVPLLPVAFGAFGPGSEQIEIRVPTRTGLRYQLRCSPTSTGPITSWRKVGPAFNGDGSVRSLMQPATNRRQFYRVEIMLPALP